MMKCPKCGLINPDSGQICDCGYNFHTKIQQKPIEGSGFAELGTKWLKFWNYFGLPVGGVLNILMSLGVPALGNIMVPIAILQFVVAYGLHNRRLWAWQLNWVLIIIGYINMVVPTSVYGVYSGEVDSVVQFLGKAVFGWLIWMWPNLVYWKKRKTLFS